MDRMSPLFREPSRDRELAAALRRAELEPEADDEAVHRRIVAAAAPRLAGLRRALPGASWWEWISAWTKVAVPVTVAAGVAAALLVPGAGAGNAGLGATTTDADSTIMAAVFAEPARGGAVAAHLIAPADHDWLLAEVIER